MDFFGFFVLQNDFSKIEIGNFLIRDVFTVVWISGRSPNRVGNLNYVCLVAFFRCWIFARYPDPKRR